jgi:hypothetical protein
MSNWMDTIETTTIKKETAYGTWADFEKATGMTKEQYFAREEQIANNLAAKEIVDCIL